jgi:hypothetical protein
MYRDKDAYPTTHHRSVGSDGVSKRGSRRIEAEV